MTITSNFCEFHVDVSKTSISPLLRLEKMDLDHFDDTTSSVRLEIYGESATGQSHSLKLKRSDITQERLSRVFKVATIVQ